MALFGSKKKEKIPETNSGSDSNYRNPRNDVDNSSQYSRSSAPPPAYGSNSSYGGSGGGGGGSGGYANPQQQNSSSQYGRPPPQQQSSYGRQDRNGYPEDRKGGNNSNAYDQNTGRGGGHNNARTNESDRNRLLSGGRRAELASGRGSSSNGTGERGQMTEEDEEVEGIKQQMRFVNQESLASTRNAVRIAREAEETARATLDKLGVQSDRIANTERHLDMAKAHNDRAADEAKELKALNRSIFRPNFNFNKSSKRDKEEQRVLNRHNEEMEERTQTREDQYESRQRIDGAFRDVERMSEQSYEAQSRARARGTERSRYQFEPDEDDHQLEDDIDQNLDDLSGIVGRLKQLATVSGQEVDAQNRKLEKLDPKVSGLSSKIVTNTQRLDRMK